MVGCGTSYYMAQTYASLREGAGLGITDAWSPTEARLDRGYDRLLAITRSGTTTEIVDLLEANARPAPGHGRDLVAPAPRCSTWPPRS